MTKNIAWIVAGVILVGGLLWFFFFKSNEASPANFKDYDCPDFSTKAEAQRFFELNGGPADDPHKLDQDKDGIACETLP